MLSAILLTTHCWVIKQQHDILNIFLNILVKLQHRLTLTNVASGTFQTTSRKDGSSEEPRQLRKDSQTLFHLISYFIMRTFPFCLCLSRDRLSQHNMSSPQLTACTLLRGWCVLHLSHLPHSPVTLVGDLWRVPGFRGPAADSTTVVSLHKRLVSSC